MKLNKFVINKFKEFIPPSRETPKQSCHQSYWNKKKLPLSQSPSLLILPPWGKSPKKTCKPKRDWRRNRSKLRLDLILHLSKLVKSWRELKRKERWIWISSLGLSVTRRELRSWKGSYHKLKPRFRSCKSNCKEITVLLNKTEMWKWTTWRIDFMLTIKKSMKEELTCTHENRRILKPRKKE